ncbi:MAG: hypothetical protein QM754_17940 [Tepidisphaeraceae bacterium]
MLILPNQQPRRYRRAKRSAFAPTPVAGPVLVSAVYEPQTAVTLTFASPVTVQAEMLTAIRVTDGDTAEQYHGENYDVLSPTRVRVNLYYDDAFEGTGVTLSAEAPTEIVDTTTGTAWAGTPPVALPYTA